MMLRAFSLSLLLFSFCLGGGSFSSSPVPAGRGGFKATPGPAKFVKAPAKV